MKTETLMAAIDSKNWTGAVYAVGATAEVALRDARAEGATGELVAVQITANAAAEVEANGGAPGKFAMRNGQVVLQAD